MTDKILIIGCGDIGTRLASRWQSRGVAVTAMARSEAAAQRLSALDLVVWHGDLDDPADLVCLASPRLHGSTLYYLAPPPASGDTDRRMAHFVACLGADNCPAHILYMGTSGVYGDSAGGWVNEQTPAYPQTARARRRLDAETTLREAAAQLGFSLTLLRVGGIYGPDRLPIKRLRQGQPVLHESECGFSNRIHVDDLLQILMAAALQPAPGVRIYNVSDNQPGNMTRYFLDVADALGLPHPPRISLAEARTQLSPAMLAYLGESRRMDSHKVLRELALTLHYPDLASGLRSLGQGRPDTRVNDEISC